MMTQVLRPQKCAKSFTTFCDMDSDRRISRQEWRSCVGLEENSKSSMTTTFNLVFIPFCAPTKLWALESAFLIIHFFQNTLSGPFLPAL
jgi:hypothetical protein